MCSFWYKYFCTLANLLKVSVDELLCDTVLKTKYVFSKSRKVFGTFGRGRKSHSHTNRRRSLSHFCSRNRRQSQTNSNTRKHIANTLTNFIIVIQKIIIIEYADALLRTGIFGESFDLEEITKNAGKSALYGAITAGQSFFLQLQQRYFLLLKNF